MIISEIKRILKESSIVVAVLLIILCLMAISDKDDFLAPTFEIFLLLYASYAGWGILDRERQEGAMEYLLSLPISRTGMFMKKFFPRLGMVLIIYSCHWLLHHFTELPFLLKPDVFFYAYIAIFLLSLSLSITLKNFITSFFIAGLIIYGLFEFIGNLDWSRPDSSSMFQTLLFLCCFPILFFILFQKLDIRPVTKFNKRFIPLAIIMLPLIIGGATLANTHKWGSYFWASNGTILRSGGNRTSIITPKGKSFNHKVGVCPLAENEQGIYVKIHTGTPTQTLGRIPFKGGAIQKLYPLKKNWEIICHPHGKSVLFRNQKAHFLIHLKRSRKFKLVILDKKNTREIPVFSSFLNDYLLSLIMVTGEPFTALIAAHPYDGNKLNTKRFNIHSISQTGTVKKLYEVDTFKVWKEHLLLVDQKKGLRLIKISGMHEILKKIEKHVKLISRNRFDTHHARKTLFRAGGKTVLIDMKSGKIIKVPPVQQPYHYHMSRKDFRIIRIKGDEIFSLVLEKNRWVPEKIWISKIKSIKKNPRIFQVFPNGVIGYNRNKFELYPYPLKSKE